MTLLLPILNFLISSLYRTSNITALATRGKLGALYSTMSGGDPVHEESKEQVNVVNADASQAEPIDKQYPTGWKFALVITSLGCGVLLVAIDNTIIAVAVPKISTDFKALDDVGWYGSAYLLTETALQPTLGNFYKYFGVKMLYLVSMVIFEGD